MNSVVEHPFNFSFTPTFNPNQPAPSAGGSGNGGGIQQRKPTAPQKKYYLDLCNQRNITPIDVESVTYEELDYHIKEVRNFYPASPKQMEMIKDKAMLLIDLGVDLDKTMSKYDVKRLTGGKDGTASQLIMDLFKLEKENNDKQPPTEKQVELLTTMYLCPDVPFENFGIKLRMELEGGGWRRLLPSEFAMEIFTKMKRNEASKFIDDYRSVFYDWKSTRAKLGQINYIRELEKRQMKIGAPASREWAVDLFGRSVEKPPVPVEKQRGYNPDAFRPLDESELLMFSEKEAEIYIDLLLSSKNNQELTKFEYEPELSLTFEELRKITTDKERVDHEFKEIQNIMFALESIQGYPDEELHEAVSSLLVDSEDSDTRLFDCKARIKDTMLALIDRKAISFEGMAELCKGSNVAIHCLIGRF